MLLAVIGVGLWVLILRPVFAPREVRAAGKAAVTKKGKRTARIRPIIMDSVSLSRELARIGEKAGWRKYGNKVFLLRGKVTGISQLSGKVVRIGQQRPRDVLLALEGRSENVAVQVWFRSEQVQHLTKFGLSPNPPRAFWPPTEPQVEVRARLAEIIDGASATPVFREAEIQKQAAGRRPWRFSEAELGKAGVEILDPTAVILRCVHCGKVWSPDLQPDGRLPRTYWRCPNGCNKTAAPVARPR
jgi:hypothetical protein